MLCRPNPVPLEQVTVTPKLHLGATFDPLRWSSQGYLLANMYSTLYGVELVADLIQTFCTGDTQSSYIQMLLLLRRGEYSSEWNA